MPFSSKSDYERVVDYFVDADEAFLTGMGVDPNKLPDREAWLNRLLPDLTRPDSQKQTFYVGWDYEGTRIGHCNMNPLSYGDQAFVHLHLWDRTARRAGFGTEFFTNNIVMKRYACSVCTVNLMRTTQRRIASSRRLASVLSSATAPLRDSLTLSSK